MTTRDGGPDPEAADARALRPLPEGRYRGFSVAGEGGMGIVYLAIDTDLDREVAFKVVRPDAGGASRGPAPAAPLDLDAPPEGTPASEAFAHLTSRFLQEARVTGGLTHPGIVPVHELGRTAGGVPYYTMRFVRGRRTLDDALAEVGGGPVEERLRLLDPFLRVCDTMAYAHSRGVIHRDLKPENVALGEYGEVVVLDWGLARLRDRDEPDDDWTRRLRAYREAADLRTVAAALGTPGYMAPEAAAGRHEEVDERSDVYGLGALLYRILTGRLPHTFATFAELLAALEREPTPAAEVDPAVPDELSDLCVAALAPDRERRPDGAAEMAAAIRAWQVRSEVDREVIGLLAEARRDLANADRTEGDARRRRLDRALLAADRALRLRPGHEEAARIAVAVRDRRDRIARRRETRALRTGMRRAAVTALGILALGAATAAILLDLARRRAETARADAVSARRRSYAAEGRARAESEEARRQAGRARVNLADAYAHLAETFVREKAFGPARVAAARARALADTPSTRAAQVRAESTPAHAGRWLPPAPGGSGGLHSVAAGGGRVCALDAQGRLVVWSRESEEVRRLGEPGEFDLSGNPLVVTRDGTRAYLGRPDGTVRLLGLDGGAPDAVRRVLPGLDITALAVTPDGSRLAVAGEDRRLVVLDARTLETLRTFAPESTVTALAVMPDGRTLAATGWRIARLLGLDDGTVVRRLEGGATACAVSDDGTVLVGVGREDGGPALVVWDLLTGKRRTVARPGTDLEAVAVSPDGARAYTTSWSGDAPAVWNLASGERSARLAPAASSPFGGSIARSTDGRRLYVVGPGRVREWDLPGEAACRELVTESDTSFPAVHGGIVLSADGGLLVWGGAGDRGHLIRAFDLARGRPLAGYGSDGQTWALALASDGLLVGDLHERRIRRLDPRTGRHLAEATAHPEGGVGTLTLGPEGRWLVSTGQRDGRIRTRDARTLAPIATFGRSGRHALEVRPHPDGARLVVVDSVFSVLHEDENTASFSHDDIRVAITDLEGRAWRDLAAPAAGPLAFLPEGRLVGRGRAGDLVIVDLASGRTAPCGARPEGLGPASAIAVSPDGSRIASLHPASDPPGTDVALVLRDVASRRVLVTLPTPHRQGSRGLVFSPDGERLFTAGHEGVRAWRLAEFLGGPEESLARNRRRYGFRLAGFRAVLGE